ncbi:RsmB/NOP family class I SAM-dependent RNA methyltransferase [Brackiella oedipodis]|uniref:RsmB/NOP family class I SAM-dependent RNA methyltransferase n=1 Tax=Brackiella oedipodis TaxID=124225 RepID=UPI0006843E2D|nr:RsmB/NOP family class I SAM-dependent RNA methyltransferase [Brackiella oedipodis]
MTKQHSSAPKKQHKANPEPRSKTALRLEQISDVLEQILKFRFAADSVLSKWFREHKKLGGRDRAEVAEAVFDVLRHLKLYRYLASSGQGPQNRRLAILGWQASQAEAFSTEGLSPYEQEWLQHIAHQDIQSLPWALRYSVPDWLAEYLQDIEQSDALMQQLNQKATLDLRVNPLRLTRDEALQQIQELYDQQAQATPFSPWGVRLTTNPGLQQWPLFKNGSLEVQDEGSQLLCLLTAPKRNELVIDFCAGAGGKTLLLGAMMRSTGRLYAFDVDEKRLAKAKPRLARSGLSNVTPVLIKNENDTRVKRLASKAHKVLVDAPCSGIGTLRRNPDLKWRQTPEKLQQLLELQQSILQSASRCVMPGGRLIYSTCSLLAQENQEQIKTFLANHPDFTILDIRDVLGDRAASLQSDNNGFLQLRPDVHGTDGFFAAVLERSK